MVGSSGQCKLAGWSEIRMGINKRGGWNRGGIGFWGCNRDECFDFRISIKRGA